MTLGKTTLIYVACYILLCMGLPLNRLHADPNPMQNPVSIRKTADVLNDRFDKLLVNQNDYPSQTTFDLNSDQGHLGHFVRKKNCNWRKRCVFYGPDGTPLFSFFRHLFNFKGSGPAMATLDVQDADNEFIGRISGSCFKRGPAKFYFCDQDGNYLAIAYMDIQGTSYTLYDYQQSEKILAIFRRNFVQDVTDNWEVEIIDSSSIDNRLLVSFASFAVDTQSVFKADN